MCDLCMAFSLFSFFMFPMRMNNPGGQSYFPSFQALPCYLSLFFLLLFSLYCLFQCSLSIFRCPNNIYCGIILSRELGSDFQETFFLPVYQLCRVREIRRQSATFCPWWAVTSGLLNMTKLEKKKGTYCSNMVELPAGTNSPSLPILATKRSGKIPSNISQKTKTKQ